MSNPDQAALWDWLRKETGLKREIGVGNWVSHPKTEHAQSCLVIETPTSRSKTTGVKILEDRQYRLNGYPLLVHLDNLLLIPTRDDLEDVIILAGEKLNGNKAPFRWGTSYGFDNDLVVLGWGWIAEILLKYMPSLTQKGFIGWSHTTAAYPTPTDALAALGQKLKVELEKK